MKTEPDFFRQSSFAAQWPAGLAVVMILFLFILALWRASLEESIWVDEIYSILLANRSLRDLTAITAFDQHPPAYYLLLKYWIRLGEMLGAAPSIFWARLPGTVSWLALVIFAWWIGNRLIGRNAGPLIAAAVGCASQALRIMLNARGYALATPALAICFLLMFSAFEASREGKPVKQTQLLVWLPYALLALLALWSHLLSSFVLLSLGVYWLVNCERIAQKAATRIWRDPLFIGGTVAQAIVVLGFLPWLVELGNQTGSLEGPRRVWMTPPTFFNYFRVFAVWYAWGMQGGAPEETEPALWRTLLGACTFILPLCFVFMRRRAFSPALRLAVAAISIALANVALTWLVDRLGIQYVFHGPRYTVFSNAIWAVGIAALCLAAAEEYPRKEILAWVLLAPWIILSCWGTIYESNQLARNGLRKSLLDPAAPAKGSTVYVTPPILIPYFPSTLADYDVHSIHDLPEAALTDDPLRVLRLCDQPHVDSRENLLVYSMVHQNQLADSVESVEFPAWQPPWERVRFDLLRHPNKEVAQRLIDQNLQPVRRAAPQGSLAFVDASDLVPADGWIFFEFNPDMTVYLWSIDNRAQISLPTVLEPGNYRLRLNIERLVHWRQSSTLTIEISSSADRLVQTIADGPTVVEFEFNLPGSVNRPVVALDHALGQSDEQFGDPPPRRSLRIRFDELALFKE